MARLLFADDAADVGFSYAAQFEQRLWSDWWFWLYNGYACLASLICRPFEPDLKVSKNI